jgi:hypothetical protein
MESDFSHAMFLMLSDVLIPDYCFVNNDAPTCAYLRLRSCCAGCSAWLVVVYRLTVGTLAETFSVGSAARAP